MPHHIFDVMLTGVKGVVALYSFDVLAAFPDAQKFPSCHCLPLGIGVKFHLINGHIDISISVNQTGIGGLKTCLQVWHAMAHLATTCASSSLRAVWASVSAAS